MNMIGPKGDLFKGRKGRLEVVGNLGDDSIALAVSSAPAVETPTSDSGRSDAALDVSPPEPLVIVPRGCAVKKPRSIPTPVVPDPPLPVVPLVQSYARKRG